MNHTPSSNDPVATVRAMFARGQAAQAVAATEKLLAQGCVDIDLLELAWKHAMALDDIDCLGRMLTTLKQVAPKLRHWRLAMLQASYHEARHEWQEKIAAIKKAKKLGLDPGTACLHEADARERLLQPEKALAVLDNFVGEGELRDHAHSIRARCLQQAGRADEARELLEEWLPQAGDNAATAASRKLLARLYDKVGRWDDAWHWVQQGNELSARLYRAAIADNDIRWRVEVWHHLYRPDSEFALPQYETDEPSPVFLVGFPRSGTTLLEQVLDAHPKIQALEEPPTVMHALRHAVDAAKARAWMKGVLKQPGLSKKQLLVRVFQQMSQFSQEDVLRLRRIYWDNVSCLLGGKPKGMLLDKMPLNTVDMAFIRMLFPRARFIVALRHPADVLLSCYMQSFEANDAMANFHELVPGAVFYRQVMGLLERYQAKLPLEENIHFIRYEDLTADFAGEIEALMDFLGLAPDESQQRYHEHARQRGTLSTPSYQGVTQPIYRGAVGRWQHYASQLKPAFEHLAPACLRFGYSLDGKQEGD